MKKYIFILALTSFYSFNSFGQIDKLISNIPKTAIGKTGISNDQAVSALKEALSVGTDTAVSLLSKADGFYKDETVKILLPPEAQKMSANISKVPGGKEMMDRTLITLNRAAEDASKEAAPIIKSAIVNMSVTDGLKIVTGADFAATSYLKDKTYTPLKNAFSPKIKASLSKPLVFGISAEDSYKDLVNTYNKASLNGMLFEKVTTNSLTEHVTTKGLDGLFLKVAMQEKKIRRDPIAQVTNLLKSVFGHK